MWTQSYAIWSKCWCEDDAGPRDTDIMQIRLDMANRVRKRGFAWRDQALPALMPFPLPTRQEAISFGDSLPP